MHGHAERCKPHNDVGYENLRKCFEIQIICYALPVACLRLSIEDEEEWPWNIMLQRAQKSVPSRRRGYIAHCQQLSAHAVEDEVRMG